MINPIQTKYAEEALSKGASEADIRNKLKGEGLTDDEVSRVFSEAKGRKDFLSGNIGPSGGSSPVSGQQAPRPVSLPPQPVFSRPTPLPSTPVFQRPTTPPPPPPPRQTPPSQPVSPPPPPRPDTRLQQDAQKIFQPLSGIGVSRMQTPHSGSKTFWLFAMIFLILIAAGAGYYFKNEIIELIFPSENAIEDNFDAYTPPASNLNQDQQIIDGSGTGEDQGFDVVGGTSTTTGQGQQQAPVDPDDAKIAVIGQAKAFLTSYFSQNKVYPTLEEFNTGFKALQSDKDAFYCYRKTGTHYVVGITLTNVSKSVLQNDLDGVYVCGSVNKDCADPVYCVAP